MNQEPKTKSAPGTDESRFVPSASGKSANPVSSRAPDNPAASASLAALDLPTGSADADALSDPARNRELLQAIDSHFYNVSSPEGKPIASLIVLVDRKRQPVRAELHLNDVNSDEAGRQAVRQAQHIIEDRYAGPDSIPMQVWQSFLRSDHPLPVQLNPDTSRIIQNSAGASASALPVKPLAYLAAAIVLVALLWAAWNWVSPDSTPATGAPTVGGLGVPVEPSDASGLNDAALAPVGDNPAPAASSLDGDLPVSVNAPANISLGKRVRMIADLSQSVRSEAGANAGVEVGTLDDEAEALVIGGPTMLQGVSDTIVWWEIQYADDVTGWVAANNSDRALLEPLD